MGKKWDKVQTAVIVVLVICLVLSFSRISILESNIEQLRSHHANEVSTIRQEISHIYQNVNDKLEQEASLLSGAQATFGELNLEAHTVAVTLTVVPKQIAQDTALQVSINGRTAELTRTGNSFTGTIPVDLFTQEEQLLLAITTDAGTQTQYLTDVYVGGRWMEYIPALYHCEISGDATFQDGLYKLNGYLDIHSSPLTETPGVRFEQYVLVTEVNGVEVSREDISEEIMKNPMYPDGLYFSGTYRREFEVREGDELAIRLEATDTLGYVHKMLLHYWKEQNGAVAETVYGGQSIYDADGNLLFGGK